MERPRLVPQIYGYAVCLVCVITILIASSALINAAFDAAAPEMSREISMGMPFDAYRTTRPMAAPGETATVAEQLPDSVWRQRYEEDRRQRTRAVRYHGIRTVVSSTLLLLIATGFFGAHWRWLRRMNRTEDV
jgi:hypothetical protein